MAQHFMTVAEQFGNSEIITDLVIQPTAAFLLAAPSTPDSARSQAIKRAEAGERITVATAKEIVNQSRKKQTRKPRRVPVPFLRRRLRKTLTWYRERWKADEREELILEMREFLNELEREKCH